MQRIQRYLIKAIAFVCLFVCLASSTNAQVIDSLKNALITSKQDTNRVNILSNLAWEMYLLDHFEESLPYIQEGVLLAEKLNHTKKLGELYKRSGDYYKFNSNYSKAIQEYTKALQIETENKNKSKMSSCYSKLAKLHVEIGEFSKAIRSYNDQLVLAIELHDTLLITDIKIELWNICYKKTGDLTEASAHLEQVQQLSRVNSSDSVRAYLYKKLGVFYSKEGDYEKAAEYLNKSFNLHNQQNKLKEMASDYYEIGSLYEKTGNYPKSLEYYLKILSIREKLGEKSSMALSYNNVGWGYQLVGDFNKALEYQLKSYKYYLADGDEIGTAYPIGNLGIIYNELGSYEKAIEYSKKAMKIFASTKDLGGVAEAHNNIGKAYLNMGDFSKAVEHLRKGLALSIEMDVLYEMKNSYSGLAACYEKLGDYKQAYTNYKLFTQVRDTIVNQENSDRVSRMHFSIENEKNQKAIELLSKDALLSEANLKRQRTLTYSAIAGVLLTFSLMFFAYRGYRQKQKSNIALEQSHAEISFQKKEIEKSYESSKLLSDIGREITASLSVEKIIENVYKNVNTLMDASSFWVGIYNEKDQQLDYPMGIEKGNTLPFAHYKLSEVNRLPVWAFINNKEVFVNDYQQEYFNYIPNGVIPTAVVGDVPESSIWYPLVSKDKKTIGILTIQSFEKNAYSQYHLSVVRSLSVFISIALENALLYEGVEQKVKERTIEIVQQKEEIEKSYRNIKLLSEMGRGITASLKVEEITEKVYESVNTLMDSPIFLIGIYNAQKKQLIVPGAIERKVKQPLYAYDLNDKSRPAVWCFDNQKELILNNFEKEFPVFFPDIEMPPIVSGEMPESLIYYPLTTANKKIGVISFQSFKKNSFSEYHLDIIRTLAIYVSTALENARLYGNMEAEVKERTKEIEKQKEELAKLSIVASETDNAIIIADAQANIEWVNASYTRLTGYSMEELMQSGKRSILDVSENPNIKQILQECNDLLKSSVYEVMNHTKDGRNIWVQTTMTPIVGSDGKITNFIAIDSDITALKRVETEIKQQHAVISEKNKHITDSINYAKRIQDAILPPLDVVKRMLPESFVLYKPKDIVSGDFYWMTEKDGKVFFAVVDCTGHGVPGAFVSIIGNNGLFRAVNEFGLTKPSEILDKLNELVDETFGQGNNTQINDGMDIALCRFDRKTNMLEFAGANNPLYIISKGELSELKGDKQPIGAFDHRKKFSNHAVTLKANDSVYIFSDGYADQFGGVKKKKFKYNQFKSMLLSINNTSMQAQKKILDDTIVNWMGELEQIDDICVVGFRA